MSEYKHKEAFCLMWYACQDCPHTERVWNSRDGVAPFSIGCPSCGISLHHVHWNYDEYKPDHKLNDGQRYFVDGTTEQAVNIAKYNQAKHSGESIDEQSAAIESIRIDAEANQWPWVAQHSFYDDVLKWNKENS